MIFKRGDILALAQHQNSTPYNVLASFTNDLNKDEQLVLVGYVHEGDLIQKLVNSDMFVKHPLFIENETDI